MKRLFNNLRNSWLWLAERIGVRKVRLSAEDKALLQALLDSKKDDIARSIRYAVENQLKELDGVQGILLDRDVFVAQFREYLRAVIRDAHLPDLLESLLLAKVDSLKIDLTDKWPDRGLITGAVRVAAGTLILEINGARL